MSAISGLYNPAGAPVDKNLLQKMNDIVAFRGPDGAGIWTGGKAGLAHRLLWTVEESVHEKQPLTNGRGLWITADCRIDNREELKREFQSRGIWRETNPPDCFYILLAYELWREEALNHLMGDFAFAIWDEHDQKLFCARDHVGLKPFVYFWDGKRFAFGSEIKQIFQDDSIPQDLNIPYQAEYILSYFSNREETPYTAVRRLPPAHSLVLEGSKLRIKKYWDWDPDSQPPSQASLEENGEKFRHVFTEAVRARLRAPLRLRTGSLLSGGLDSSSITAVAASLQTGLPVFTLHFPEAKPAYRSKKFDPVDESLYSESLIRKYGLEAHAVEIRGQSALENFEEYTWHQDMPLLFPNLAYFCHLFQATAESGVRTLMHGEGGDEIFSLGPQCLLAELKKGRWRAPLQECRARKRMGGSYVKMFERAVRVLAPEWMKAPYRYFFPRKILPDWINPDFSQETSLRERCGKAFYFDAGPQSSRSYGIQSWLRSASPILYLETLERAAASRQIELRLPFLDLRILRLAATFPWQQKNSNGLSKRVLREALKDLLTAPILNRPRKSEFSPAVRSALEKYSLKEMKEVFENPHPLLNPIILADKVENLFRAYFFPKKPHDIKVITSVWQLWAMMSVDQWLKRREKPQQKKENNHEKKEKFAFAEKKIGG